MSNITTRQTLQPQSMQEAIQFSEILSKSAMVPRDFQGKPANVLVAVQWGMELGLQPLQALQNISVINGRPSVYGDALLAMVRADSRCVGVNEYIEGEGDDRTAVCTVKRKHGGEIEEITRTFSVSQAKQAGLWSKTGPWKSYPERMLQHRARGNALRDGFPDVLAGMSVYEELRDMEDVKDITPTAEAVTAPTLEDLSKPKEVVSEAPIFLLTMCDDDGQINVEKRTKGVDDFCSQYNDEMLRIAQYEGALPTVRRTKLKELEQANISAIDALPDDLCAEMYAKRLQYNRHLSVAKGAENNG